MENKFVKKPTPKGDKSTKIVFIGLLVALLFIIAGTAIFFAVNSSSKATKVQLHPVSRVRLSIPGAMQKTPCSKSP